MKTVFVTNNSDKHIVDTYAFKQYEFAPGETVEVPEGMARHTFGYGDNNKEPYMARLAIIRTRNDIPEGLKIFEKIDISETKPEKNHALSPVVEKVPLPVQKRVRGTIPEAAAA